MPYPNEHAARMRDPGDFLEDTFRRKKIADGVSLILGKLKQDGQDGPMTEQAYRFAKDKFTAAEAKKWLKDHDVKSSAFEEAASEKALEMAEKSIELMTLREIVSAEFARQFGQGSDSLWANYVYDDHVVATEVQSGESAPSPVHYYKAPYTYTATTVGDNEEVITAVTFAPRAEWVAVAPTFTELKLLKQEGGRTRWLAVSSGGYEDRERTVIPSELLEGAVAIADKANARGPLLFYHIPSWEIGNCDYQAVIGGFLVESGLLAEGPVGEATAKALTEHGDRYGISIKFLHQGLGPDGTYVPPGVVIERSVLPAAAAAFPWSAITVKELDAMSTKGVIPEAKLAALKKFLGGDEALLQQFVARLEASGQTLQGLGVRFKELTAEKQTPAAEAANQTSAPANAGTAGAAPAELAFVLDDNALAAIAEQVGGVAEKAVNAKLTPVEQALAKLQDDLASLAASIADLARSDEDKIAEKVAHLPRATMAHVTRPTQATTLPPAAEAASMLAQGLKTLRD